MKYLFYYIWISLAFFQSKLSKILFPIRKFLFKIKKTTKEKQKEWKDDYNKGFWSFPGGMVDWGAYGLLLALIFIPIIILSVIFEINIFNPQIYFWSLFIGIGVICYYSIYFKNIDWLKEKINKVSKKYYL